MRRTLGSLVLTLGLVGATSTSAPAQTPGITPADADTIAAAVADSSVTPAESTAFVTVPPSGTPNGIADVTLTTFPTDGATYGIMTSGNAQLADDPNTSGSSGTANGGGAVRGNTDRDVSILRVDFTASTDVNCLSFDFRFLSEEFPEFVGGSVNDAFVAELDTSTWTTLDSDIVAPNNFAFDPSGQVISINSSGVTSMSSEEAAGTTYDGATPLLRASTPVTSGAHSAYFSIFDQGDDIYDSAVFLDNLSLFAAPEGACQEGAQQVAPSVTKAADDPVSAPGGTNGYTITIDNPNDEAVTLNQITDTLPAGFAYQAGSTTGAISFDPSQEGQTLVWQNVEGPLVEVPAEGSISLHFDVTVATEPGVYLNEAEASSPEVDVVPSGPTAPISVLASPTIEKAADAATSPPGGSNGYTITIANPNDVDLDLDEVTDTLPAGFAYVAGSTTGDVAGDPSIVGQTLTWEALEGSLLTVPAEGAASLSFDVTVSTTPGAYLNEAAADGSGFALETGPTAQVTVPAPPVVTPPALPCDPITIEGTGAGETLMGTTGADRIRGLAGRDRIDALAGDDVACAGLGGDYLYGRDGLDTLRGEEGNDRLYGGRSGDVLEGGPGHDAILGGRGPDTILAADGATDCIVTGRGDDSVTADPFDVVDPKKGCPPGFWL
jgi:uncharacterized repeat protein (TIGR01451 family)